MTMMMVSSNGNNINGNMMDTTLTKVFVGGLAWGTPKEALRDHFQEYGEILEAVIISDKLTGRSKGYGFVTFKDADAAKKACEDSNPIINGRRANCNLAALGAKRPKSSSTTAVATNPLPPPQQVNVEPKAAVPFAQGKWHYSNEAQAMASPFRLIPYFGYTPSYVSTTDFHYDHKLGFFCGTYMTAPVYPMHAVIGGNSYMSTYTPYRFQQSRTLGLPAHMFSPLRSKPTSTPAMGAVCRAVE